MFNRQILADVYPRRYDPFRPPSADGTVQPDGSGQTVKQTITDVLTTPITMPGERPKVYQRGVNFSFNVTAAAQPLSQSRFEVDSFIIDNPVANIASVFFGFGGGISVTSGLEVRPGLPIEWATDNTREQWELQRALERMYNLMAFGAGAPIPDPYKAPRVVYDLSNIFIIAAGPLTVAITAFFPPEQQ